MSPTAVFLLFLCSPAPLSAQGGEDSRAFTYPLTRYAREKAVLASDHLAGQRWSKAIEVLQEMITDRENAVLPDDFRASADEFSANLAHPGAGEWARERLLGLPADARALYRDRHEHVARTALQEAVHRRDRRALVAVADRWPLCDASIRAWWILGDLEMEEGHPRSARVAWERAEAGRLLTDSLPNSGTRARMELAREALLREEEEWREDTAAGESNHPAFPVDPTLPRGPLPSRDALPWSTDLELAPFDPATSSSYYYSLYPALLGDRVFVNSSLEVFCLDAFTGELLWRSGRPDGWEDLSEKKQRDLFEGLDRNEVQIAPDAGSGIVVAGLQLPYSQYDNQDFQGIDIMAAIPERRLFAFDAATGERLWDHSPKLAYDEARSVFQVRDVGSFAQGIQVSGPPTVADSRVLVPSYAFEGRIDYHVACYALESGELLWSTGVVSGQRERNMFGRSMKEFCASPVVVADDKVIVQTELGTVAALDLMTGRILWESLYQQVPLPKSPGYTQTPRRTTWRLAPPAIAGNVVISTPVDSDELTAFDLQDGRVLWTAERTALTQLGGGTPSQRFDLLIGAGRDAIYLAGGRIAKLSMPSGLREPSQLRLEWQYRLDPSYNFSRAARPVLGRDHVLLPLPGGRVVLDRRDGLEQRSLCAQWEEEYGTALVANGRLFTLGARRLSGFLDWDLLVERQERLRAGAPDDPAIAVATATLYSRRAAAALERSELFAALSFLAKGRAILEPVVAGIDADESATDGLRSQAADELHLLLRREARVLEEQGNRNGALRALAAAKDLARSPIALRDTLLQTERNLRGSAATELYLEVLAELERTSSDLALTLEAALGAIVPIDVDRPGGDVPTIGLWVLLTRAATLEREARLGEAFEDWHRVLERYPDVLLATGAPAADHARRRIAARLGSPAGRTAYERFEARAAALYARALEEDSVPGLERVGRLFPHSRAAVDADHARLDRAFESADAEYIASVVYGRTRGDRGCDDAGMLLRLGRVLGRLGNAELELSLVRSLAAQAPETPSDLPEHGGRTLSELEANLTAELPARTARLPRFDESVRQSAAVSGAYEFLGRFLSPDEPEGSSEELHVYLFRSDLPSSRRASPVAGQADRVEAFSSTDLRRPAWYRFLEEPVIGPGTCALSRERVILGGARLLQAFDREGRPSWTRSVPGTIASVSAADGVVVAQIGTDHPEGLLAFDAHSGIPLWSLPMDDHRGWLSPVFGDGIAVVLAKEFPARVTARVVDLFRGRVRRDIDLERANEPNLERTTWISGGRLFVPCFSTTGNRRYEVIAFDLESGAKAWSCPLPDHEQFLCVARVEEDSYLITATEQVGASGGVYSLDHSYGSLRRIVPLRTGELPIGLRARELNRLPTPDLFTYADNGANQVVVRALHLPYQVRWSRTLRIVDLDLRRELPRPAVSEDTVALAYVEQSSGGRGQPWLAFLDRNTGQSLDTLMLEEDFASSDPLELRGLGEALFLIGGGHRSRGWLMQILEKTR